MEDRTYTKTEIIAALDALHAEGFEILLKWEGGSDSGWYWIEIDEVQYDGWNDNNDALLPKDMVHTLLSMAGELMNYGSFAGEYQTAGELTYSSENKWFEGVDTYSEDEYQTIYIPEVLDENHIHIDLPVDFPFDTLYAHVDVNAHDEKKADVDFDFSLDNGINFEDNFKEDIEKSSKYLLEKSREFLDVLLQDREVESISSDIEVSRSDFKLINETTMRHTLSHLDCYFYKTEQTDVCLEIDPGID
jgi:hypothetical protein